MPENSGENREYSGEQDSRENMPIEKERIRSTRYERRFSIKFLILFIKIESKCHKYLLRCLLAKKPLDGIMN